MKLTINKKDLLTLLSRGQGIADKKSPMPALGCVLLDAKDGLLRVAATDLRIGIDSGVECQVVRPGSVALPARDLFDRIKSMPEGPLSIDVEVDSSKAVIKAIGSARRHTIEGLPGREYPNIARPGQDYARVKFPALALSRLLGQVEFSINPDINRPVQNGALIEWGGGVLRTVSTDGHRLTTSEAAFDAEGAGSLLVPQKAVVELRRLLDVADGDNAVTVDHGPAWAFFSLAGITLSVCLPAAIFPPYQQVIPFPVEGQLVAVPRVQLADAVRSVGLATEDIEKGKAGGVIIGLSSEKITIDAGPADTAKAHDELAVTYGGKDRTWRMNHRYLLEALGAVDCDEVEFFATGDLDPILMRPVGDGSKAFTAVLMPMRA